MGNRAYRNRKGILAAAALMCMAVCSPVHVLQAEETEAELVLGTYTVPEGWSEDTSAESTDTRKIYKKQENLGLDTTSTITCSYIATNYSVLEYEQLRDMLTNDMMYSNVNAEISANAAYTDNKDYLYILTTEDASKDYREIFYYVVGDMECFQVQVKEYRTEADSARETSQKTPEETGKEIATKFVW